MFRIFGSKVQLNMNSANFKLAEQEIKKICTNSPKNNCEHVFCKLHEPEYLGSHEKNSHVCVACNLNDSIEKIYKFLKGLKNEDDIEYSFTIFILLCILSVEKLTIIFKHIGISQDYVEKNWTILVEIRKWANFIKHPKGFLFSHHPVYLYENEKIDKTYQNWKVINYDNFIEPLYKREDEGKYIQTISQIGNKKDILVIIPNPFRLVTEFNVVCNKICEKIKNNEHFKEILKHETVIDDYN